MRNADMPAMPTVTYDHGAAMQGLAVSVTDAIGLTKREAMAMHVMASIATTVGYQNYGQMAQDAIAATDALLAELERTK